MYSPGKPENKFYEIVLFYDPAEKRDKDGRWTKGNARPGFTEATEEQRKKLRIPPAWTDVHIAEDPNSSLQAIGTDSKGRKQYRYSAAHTEKQSVAKFARGQAFNEELPQIVERFNAELKNGGPHVEEAAVLALIYKTGFRVGGSDDTGADKQAYGASTLLSDHVKVEGSTVKFDFIGKKGVKITKTLDDPEIANDIAKRASRGGKLYDTSDAKVLSYLHTIDGEFKVKDFRTWNACGVALEVISKTPPPSTPEEFKKAVLFVGKRVADHLGNTPSVALTSYIDPRVFQEWETNLKTRQSQFSAGKQDSCESRARHVDLFYSTTSFDTLPKDYMKLTDHDPEDE